MIRHESEYRLARERVASERARLVEIEAKLKSTGISSDEVELILQPLITFRIQLEEEIARYERLQSGDFSDFTDIEDLGALLIAKRIANGMTQRELAKLLEVDESQVSRDERNEYHRISINRTKRIAEVLGLQICINATGVSAGGSHQLLKQISFTTPAQKTTTKTRVLVTFRTESTTKPERPLDQRWAA